MTATNEDGKATHDRARGTILLVEDDHDVRETLSGILQALGHGVTCAVDGDDAFARLRSGSRPALILLDLMMPNMDGYAFHAAIKEDPAFAAIPILVVTAVRDASRESLGAVGCVKKPFDCDELLRLVNKYC